MEAEATVRSSALWGASQCPDERQIGRQCTAPSASVMRKLPIISLLGDLGVLAVMSAGAAVSGVFLLHARRTR
jgi:hypothetical protein